MDIEAIPGKRPEGFPVISEGLASEVFARANDDNFIRENLELLSEADPRLFERIMFLASLEDKGHYGRYAYGAGLMVWAVLREVMPSLPPLTWTGELLADHETDLLRRAQEEDDFVPNYFRFEGNKRTFEDMKRENSHLAKTIEEWADWFTGLRDGERMRESFIGGAFEVYELCRVNFESAQNNAQAKVVDRLPAQSDLIQ